jgi:hypothetical protein
MDFNISLNIQVGFSSPCPLQRGRLVKPGRRNRYERITVKYPGRSKKRDLPL